MEKGLGRGKVKAKGKGIVPLNGNSVSRLENDIRHDFGMFAKKAICVVTQKEFDEVHKEYSAQLSLIESLKQSQANLVGLKAKLENKYSP